MFSLDDVARAIGGRREGRRASVVPSGFSVDSRRVQPGDLFFALPGARVDGHAFVGDAFARGAVAAVVSDLSVAASDQAELIWVDDVRRGLVSLARAWRERLSAPLVGVTGSNGKTTTKALLAHLLGGPPASYASPENYNTEVGVPLALLSMPETAAVGVLELAADRPGDLAPLADLVRPSAALITSVGPSHLDGFGTVDAVATEKWTLAEAINPGGWVLANADSPQLRERAAAGLRAELVTVGLEHGDVRGHIQQAVPLVLRVERPRLALSTNLLGAHNATNVLLAALAALRLGASAADVERRAATFGPAAHRMERRRARFGVVLDDVYNANPSSVAAALDVLVGCRAAGQAVFIFGDMLGLGEGSARLHDETVRRALSLAVDAIYPVGEAAAAAARRVGDPRILVLPRERVAVHVAKRLADTTDAAVLVKGSRGVGLESLVDELLRLAPYSA
ncbi:MAG: UDP-N-acetylmuramoyl-tripeptide--D-alanyl-D-alanine ligase [Candidatus Bipolaricaulota bacterium]